MLYRLYILDTFLKCFQDNLCCYAKWANLKPLWRSYNVITFLLQATRHHSSSVLQCLFMRHYITGNKTTWFTTQIAAIKSAICVGLVEGVGQGLLLIPRILMMTSSNGNIFRVTGHFLRGIHRSPVNSPHKGQWRGALMFSLICVWINCWVNNREAGVLRRYRVHYDVIVMSTRDIMMCVF